MNIDTLNRNYTQILKPEELKRVKIKIDNEKNEVLVYANVHDYSVREANAFLERLIKLSRDSLHLVVNHGFNRGHAIKDFLSETKINYRIVWQTKSRKNPGLTHMGIRAIA